MRASSAYSLFDTESVWAILMRIAPPVMLAQLIQAMYNIVDSYFVGQFSSDGLTALSIVYPVQLIVTAIAVGTGVGVNTLMSRYDGQGNHHLADRTAGTGTVLALISWLIFAVLSGLLMRPFAAISTESSSVADLAVTYGTIVCVGSPGVFLESTWSKVHQARGNMRLPMLAQIAGAAANIVLDPILIFGLGPAPALGVAGAAFATVSGQVLAALIVVSGFRKPPPIRVFRSYAAKIYRLGFPSIFMQLLFTVYIMALNMILAGFSDDAVTVLGLYYKVQSFFFIPLSGLQTCIVPLLSYTYAKGAYGRCRRVVKNSVLLAMSFMLVGIACFELIPEQLLRIFTAEPAVLEIGVQAFHIIGISFLPAVPSLILPVFFQAIAAQRPALPDQADLLPDSRILALLQDRSGLHVAGLSHCGSRDRNAGPVLLSPPHSHLGPLQGRGPETRTQRSDCHETHHRHRQQTGHQRGLRRPDRRRLLLHPHGLHRWFSHRRQLHTADRHRGGPGAPGHRHHPPALLPPDGEDLLQRATGHTLCGLSHGGDRRRCHAVRLRCDAV